MHTKTGFLLRLENLKKMGSIFPLGKSEWILAYFISFSDFNWTVLVNCLFTFVKLSTGNGKKWKRWGKLSVRASGNHENIVHLVADPGFPLEGGVDLMGGVDFRDSYVSIILYVKTKESLPLGGMRRARPLDLPMALLWKVTDVEESLGCWSAIKLCYDVELDMMRLRPWRPDWPS